jgi:hypothetical protein
MVMDKILLVGGYEFLSFHLCMASLDKGIHVQCIHIENSHDTFLEEKKFSVGRNANFSEVSRVDWVKEACHFDGDTPIIVSLYDLFLNKDSEKILAEIEIVLNHIFQHNRMDQISIVFMLPLQLLDRDKESYNPFFSFLKKVEEKGISYKSIYLPTLYGPWQPMEYLFQQALLTQLRNHEDFQFNKKEWVFDCLYIEDAAREIVSLLEEGFQTCLLKSNQSETWKRCADFLGINSDFYKKAEKINRDMKDIPMKEITENVSLEQGLSLQKQHLLRILSGV